jgi:CheY-like chemotaxis protein
MEASASARPEISRAGETAPVDCLIRKEKVRSFCGGQQEIELRTAKWYNHQMRKPRAIVCDDDDVVLVVFRHILEAAGYEVLTSDTPVACAFYREHGDGCPQHNRCTDILVTDNAMPGMTGLELLEMQHRGGCKLTSKNKALITGSEDTALKERAAVLGSRLLPKPVPVATFLAWLQECERRFDLSEPLASDLYLPAKKKTFSVDSR